MFSLIDLFVYLLSVCLFNFILFIDLLVYFYFFEGVIINTNISISQLSININI